MKKTKRTTKIFSSLDRSTRPRSTNGNGARARWSQYHSLLDSATLSIVETDLSGRIVDCNPVLANLLRSAPEKVKHRKFVTLASEKSRSKEIATRDEVLERGSTDEYEIELMREDGTAFPVIIKKWLQSNRYGKAQRIWMLVRDITEKKKNGDAFYRHVILLLENQLRNQSLLAGAPIGILTIDGNGRIESSNPAAEELLCAKSDEVIRKRLDEFVTSPSGKALSISPGQPQTAVAKWQNGRILPVQVTFSELRTKDELLFTCFLRDMTGDMQIRETLQRAHDDLADRVREGTEEIARLFDALQIEINERTWVQEQFRVAVESAPNGILILNQEGRIVLLNAHVEQIFGYGREELLGRPFELLVAEKYRSVLPHPPENRLAQAQVNWMGRGQELYGLRKDATEFPVEIGLNPIHTPSGTGLLMSVIDVTERKRVESELKRSAFHDGLTGLPNRTLFLDNLLRLNAAAKRHGHHPFALVFLDLDRFKVINDSLGHSAGDKLLIEMSQRLVECTREEDTVARLGGDEFALLLEQVRGPEDAVRVAERVLERLADPLVLDGNEVSITGSIGIALSLTGEKNPEDLLRDADMAMYQAKTRRLGYQIFDAKMHARALDRMRLEIDMKRAIERQQIQLHYQPIISLETGKLAGFEALARWQHDGRGTIPPARFIPLAEETGLVTPLESIGLQAGLRAGARLANALQLEQ
jgi:diguanylate cyclase (GGDEF)-like protein/PAS domain S-box-containing protein